MSNELTFTDLQDAIEKAQILINEELYVDAKKILRKVLIIDPDQSDAKSLLNEIQKIELDQLMDLTKNIKKNTNEKPNLDEILEGLEKVTKTKLVENKNQSIELFKNDKLKNEYLNKLNEKISKINDRDLLDLSIAFYEMELFEFAVMIIQNISNHSDYYMSAQIIICKSLIELNKPIEAIVKLENILKKSELKEQIRCNVNYLLGNAYEKLKDFKRANEYYRYVYQLNPRFKDVMEKLK